MDAERSPGHLTAEVRVDLLRLLAHSLELAHAAVAGSDLREITRQTACQQELCAKLRQLPADPAPAPATWSAGGEAPLVRNGEVALGGELVAVATKVAQLNHGYEVLLRRARRTVDIFCRVLAHSAVTYPPPRPEASTFAAGLQE